MNLFKYIALGFFLVLSAGCSERALALWQIRHSPNPEKRIEAVRKLGEIADEEAFNGLVFALGDKDTRVSIEAMENLSDLEVSAIDALLGALEHKSPQVRRRAIQALGRMYGEVYTFRMLSEDSCPDNLSGKVKRVNQVGTAVIKRLCDWDSLTREDACNLLSQFRTWWKPDSAAVEPLIDAYAYTDSTGWIRGQVIAVELMSNINDRRLLPPLIDALNSRNGRLGEPAAYGLERIKGSEAVQALSAALRNPHPNYQWQVAKALGSIGDSTAVEVLIDALNSEDETTREYAAGALGYAHDPRAVHALIRALDDDSERVRGRAALALGDVICMRERVFNALTRALKDKSPFVRACAAKALGRSGDSRALELLIGTIVDRDPEVRGGAISGLASLKDQRAVGPLEEVLKDDEYSSLRHDAAWALKQITGKEYEVSEEGVKYFPGVCSH